MSIMQWLGLIGSIIHYNLKIIFANRFIYFLATAIIFFLVIITINLFSDASMDVVDMYYVLLFPGILIIFYPVVYNVQNDKDTRVLEILFGVPNYRFKVYMVRFGITLVLLFGFLFLMAWFSVFAITQLPVFEIVYQLMFPLSFLACLALLMSTLVRNGNGAAVIMILIGLIFWFMAEPLSKSKWNIFLNPFTIPNEMNITIWQNIIKQNRLMLVIGEVIFLLWGLINLQHREKFV